MPNSAAIRNSISPLIAAIAFIISIFPQDAANPFMMTPVALLSVYTLLSGRLSQINYRDLVLFLTLLLWLGWIWGAIFSPVPFASQVTLVILATIPVAYLSASGRDITKFLYIVIAIISLFALASITNLLLNGYYSRAKFFFDDENILGGLIAVAIPVLLSFCFTAQTRKAKIITGVIFAILIGGLLATQSRSAFIGVMIGIAALLFKSRALISRRSLKLFILPAILLFASIFFTYFGDRLLMMLEFDKDVMGRFVLYSSALRMIAIDPLHGVGLGIFHLYYPHFKTLADNSAGFWVHNDPLQWAVETGLGTIVAFYALFGYIIYKFLRHDLTPLQTGAGASLITIFITGHINYNFHYTAIGLMTGIFLSCFAQYQTELQTKTRYIPATALLITILLHLWLIASSAPTLYLWTKAVGASQKRDMKTYADYLQLCIDKGNPAFPACRIEASGYLIKTIQDPPKDVLNWLDTAEKAAPPSPEADIWRARYYLKKNPNNLDLVEKHLRKALEKNPSLWPPRSLLVQILTAQKKYREAFDTLEPARKWQINHDFLDEFYKLERDLQEKVK